MSIPKIPTNLGGGDGPSFCLSDRCLGLISAYTELAFWLHRFHVAEPVLFTGMSVSHKQKNGLKIFGKSSQSLIKTF